MNQVVTTEAEQLNLDQDYYEILGLTCDCTNKEIKRSYRILASRYLPDRDGDVAWFHLIKEAYNVLIDPKSRANYDEFGRFTQDEYENARAYIKSVVEQVITKVEDLEHVDIVATLKNTTAKNIELSTGFLSKQEKIRAKFEKNEHRTKNDTILEVFAKHKGVAIEAIKGIKTDLRMFDVAAIMIQDYKYNFEQREVVMPRPTPPGHITWTEGDW